MTRRDYSHRLAKHVPSTDIPASDLWLEQFEAHNAVHHEMFEDQFGLPEPGSWLINCWGLPLNSLSIASYPPHQKLRSWHFVSCGLSIGKWDSFEVEKGQEACSGHGCEFVISLPQMETWAADLIKNLIRYILSENGNPVDFYHTIYCKEPIRRDSDTQLKHLTILKGIDYDWAIRLPAGNVDFCHLYGLTDAESELIRNADDHLLASQAIGAAALEKTGNLDTDIGRSCFADDAQFIATFERHYYAAKGGRSDA